MKRFVRMAALLLALLTVLSLGACGDVSPATTDTEPGTEPAAPQKIVLNEAGKEYKVVRGDDASDEETDLAVYLRNSIREIAGFDLEIDTDYYKTEDEISPYEILVGTTNRPETAQANAEIDGNGFVIAVINGKIVINATNMKSLEAGCNYFLDEILQDPNGIVPNVWTCQADTVVSGAKINGVQLKDYTISVSSKKTYELPIYTANRYFSKYCGVELEAAVNVKEGHKIVIGGTKPDGSEYSRFEIGIWYKDGDLHLGCANATMAEQVLYTFFDMYLDEPGVAEITLPEDGTEAYTYNTPDNWDNANPKTLTMQDMIVRSCYKLEAILEYDTSIGKPYTYQGSGYKNTIKQAREANNRTTNCVIVGNWVLKDAGFFGVNGEKGIYNHTYSGNAEYDKGQPGWTTSGESKNWFAENCIVTKVWDENKGVSQLTKEGRILPGDIIGYRDHNQTILPLGYALDGGRFSSNMETAATGGKFNRWVGPNPCSSTRVGYIVRTKDAD